jgi:outer membrane protein TolC
MPFRRIILLTLIALTAHGAGVANIGVEFFGPGTKAELLSLEQAIEMALKNNLDARFEHIGIAVEEARRRTAAGQFDPTISANAIRESIRRPQNVGDFTSTEQVRQAAQVDAINQQNAALIDQRNAINANTAATAAQAAAIAADVALRAQLAQQPNIGTGSIDRTTIDQQLAAATAALTRVTSGLSTAAAEPVTNAIFQSATVFDQQNDRINGGVQGRTPWGMRYGFQVEANRLRNTYSGDIRTVFPEYQTSATVTVIQPLLRNFGPDANLADLRIARLNKQAQILTWKLRVSTAVQNVISTYYDMLYAMRDVDLKEAMIASGNQLLAQNKRRLELGFMSPLDVQQAEVAVSTDREALIIAKGFFMERQFALKRLILSELQSGDHRIFIPTTAPRLPVPKIDRGDFMLTALARRYDYQAALLDTEVQNIRLRFARNQLWPQVDLVGTYGLNGLQGNYGDSFDQGFSGHTPEWSAGVQIQIPWGFVKERAQVNLVKGLKEQSIIKVKQTELTVGVDVDTVISRILTNQQRVDTARKTRELNEEAVRVGSKRLAEGQISSFELIEQTQKLGDAQSRELATVAELNKSISQLWLVTGTILDRQGIFFDK